MLLLKESDRPKSFGEKVAEFLARPPQPILRFYGDIAKSGGVSRHVSFSVRNGLPLPLFYGIYVETSHDSRSEYIEKTDHIGPFSVDDWRLTIESVTLADVEIRVGVLPFEILTDQVKIVV